MGDMAVVATLKGAMSNEWPLPIEGECGCGSLRYRLERAPIFVHCCNCRQCQRETGSAFVLNALVESDQVKLVPGKAGKILRPQHVLMPSESGLGQLIARCSICCVAVWSHYSGAGPFMKFVRAGTLDRQSVDGTSIEEVLKPDIFIYTKFKQPWTTYPEYAKEGNVVMDEFYSPGEKWTKDGVKRFQDLKPKMEEWKGQGSSWKELFPDLKDCR